MSHNVLVVVAYFKLIIQLTKKVYFLLTETSLGKHLGC